MKYGLAIICSLFVIFWFLPEDDIIIEKERGLQPNEIPVSVTGGEQQHSALTSKHQLIIDIHLKNLFDRYLLQYPEQTLDTLSQKLKAELASYLITPDVDAALIIWQNYLDLKRALVDFDETHQNQELTTIEAINKLMLRQKALIDLRAAYLGKEVSEAFYAEDHIKDQQTLDRMSIILDESLSPEQKEQSLQIWQDNLPEETRRQRQRVTEHWAITDMSQTLSGDELNQARSEILDPATISRLEALDQKQSVWKNKISEFKQYSLNLPTSGLSPEDQKLALQDYLGKTFTPQEQLRITALHPDLL